MPVMRSFLQPHMRDALVTAVVIGTVLLLAWVTMAPAYTGPADATARCGDGSLSYSQHSSGTCSWHGGVKAWNHTDILSRVLHTHPSLADDPCYGDDC
jgi:hypothetical protein